MQAEQASLAAATTHCFSATLSTAQYKLTCSGRSNLLYAQCLHPALCDGNGTLKQINRGPGMSTGHQPRLRGLHKATDLLWGCGLTLLALSSNRRVFSARSASFKLSSSSCSSSSCSTPRGSAWATASPAWLSPWCHIDRTVYNFLLKLQK
jgi:hypothetical protein